MRLPSLAAALLALSSSSSLVSAAASARNYDTHDYYAVHLDSRASPAELASHLGLEYDGPLAPLDDHYVFKAPRHSRDVVRDAVNMHKKRKRSSEPGFASHVLDSVLLNQKQKLNPLKEKRGVLPEYLRARQSSDSSAQDSPTKGELSPVEQEKYDIARELEIKDPLFHDQWHLGNYKSPGLDLNVSAIWKQGITGKNATVCIIDDGLDMSSADLRANYYREGSWDFNDKVNDPAPRLSDDTHGTRCAGEVAAVRNDVCGVGVAYDSRISAIRILSKPISDVDEAEAMAYHMQDNDIYSCSWGPPDDGKEMGRPGILIRRALQKAVTDGRGGLGSIYVFAAGNGAARDDNCNFDGYTNSIYSVTVGAIDHKGLHPYYAEKCSANLIVAYSSGSGDAIHTTNVGGCSETHGGTSAAGPLAAGVYALVLDARPDLSWRDIQWLSVENAVPFETPGEPTTYDWQNTTIGKRYSHQYGYGKLDAGAFVEAAKTFEKKKPQVLFTSPWQHIRQAIPQSDQGLSSHVTVTKKMLEDANVARLEHVTVTMNVEHTRRGDLSVELRSPSGVVSHISTARAHDEFPAGYDDWTFMSVAHWGESGEGDWTVVVKDTKVNQHTGTFTDWRIKLYGEAIDADKAAPLPLEEDGQDDDHDKEPGVASTISVELPTSTAHPEHPSDHPDRPVNVRPSSTTTAASTAATATSTAAFEKPVSAGGATDGETEDEVTSGGAPPPESAEGEESSKNESFLPSPFPTFGVSKRTQVWIYGAFALIVVFCVSLGLYFWIASRRRQRRLDREAYEFDRLDADDDDDDGAGHDGARRGGAAGGRGKRRAGELYDAFAGESDEDLFSDDGDGYRDDDARERDDEDELDEKRRVSSDGDSSGKAAQ